MVAPGVPFVHWPNPPTVDAIRQLRIDAGLTQESAGRLLFVSAGRWREWERGRYPMHPAFWELFCRKLAEDPPPG